MANVLSLALKINADASGLKLDPVSRALQKLGEETDRVSGIFDKFTGTSEAAARAQEATQKALNDLIAARQAGTVKADEFAESFRAVEEAAKRQAAEFQRGADISERYTTEEEKRARTLAELEQLLQVGAIKEDVYAKAVADASGATAAAAEAEKQRVAALAEAEKQRQSVLDEGLRLAQRYATEDEKRTAGLQRIQELLDQGAITEEVAARARADASGANEAAAKAEQQRAEAVRRAAQITEQNLTPLQRYDAALAELDAQLQAGRISQETYTRATEKAAKGLTDAERAARGLEAATEKIDDNAGKTTLQFNELSGIFAALPGPIGNVAGRISGLSSAGEGLGRIFAGGLSQGIGSLGASVAALVNPFTLAVAGITAFGAAATAVINGLSALDDRVEKLGNTAGKLGVSFGFIQTLDEAARRSGTSIDAVSAAFGRLQKSVLGVDEESKAAQKALAEIGVTAEELQSLSPDQQYQRIGAALASIEDPARRTAAATALFGRSGSELMPFFNNIDKAAADMERFGAAISDVDRGRIDSLGDGFDQVFLSIQGLGQSVLLPFAGLVEGIAKAFSGLINIVTAVAQAIGAVLGPVLDTVGAAFGLFGDAVNGAVGFFRSLLGGSQETAQSQAAVAESVSMSAEEVEKLGKAITDGNKSLDSVIAKAGEFGQAGFNAALEFQNALADLQEQADAKELNAEQYARGVANATAEFEKQIDVARRAAEENKRLAEEARRRAEAEAEAVQKIIDAAIEQQRIDEQFAGDSSRAKAATNLTKLLAEQTRVEEQLAAARASGDQESINALTARLATLDQVAARERDIASGAAKDREDAAKAAAKSAEDARRLAEQQAQAVSRVNEQILAKTEEFNARQFEIELERANELANVRTGSVQINDLRSGGISQFFETLQEDPAIAEAKKQRAELEKIRKEIAKLNAERVDILAGTG